MNAFLNAHRLRGSSLAFISSLLKSPLTKSHRLGLRNSARYLSLGAVKVQERIPSSSYSGHVPQVPYGFRELGIRDAIAKAITEAFPDVQRPTIAQADFIPAILTGKDVLLQDDTGTGKSFGAIIALLNKPRVVASRHQEGPSITSLVIVPHRDLGYQMMHWIDAILRHSGPHAPSADVIAQLVARSDSTPIEQQVHKLRTSPPHVLIGTPQALWEICRSEEDRRVLQLESLSTIVIDEVDYLLDIPSPYVRKSRESGAWRKFRRHPSLTRQLLEVVLTIRKPGAVPLAEIDYNDDRNGGGGDKDSGRVHRKGVGATAGGRPVQLVMSSATVHSNLVDYLCDARWLGEDRLILSGKQLLKANSHMLTGENALKPRILHHAFVVSPDGKLRNVEYAGRPGQENGNEEEEDEDRPKDTREMIKNMRSISPQSPTCPVVMEAIATIFAADVSDMALLVLPTGSSIKKAIEELQDLGIDARPLDLRPQRVDDQSNGEPILLVATPATIRGVDLPQLTHVFCAGAPDTSSADVFKHASGRVGRFGREGKVMTFVTERQVEREEGVVKTTKNPPGLLKTFYRKLHIQPVWYDLDPVSF